MKASPAVSLLLTNLQLLDYYSSEDAFPISIETFTSLKNKGKAFEHIVHHLFHAHQPVEAAARFQACWPIYEPIQSKELRNVVFKWLTDLKKSGQLQTGGNVIIRRSLFDDCSGERYEELLLALSTMVLRNQVEREVFNDKYKQTIAYKQCTTHTPSLGLLTPLTLAHQSSLTRLLVSRNASKTHWSTFLSLLRQREADLLRMSARLPVETAVPGDSGLEEDEVASKWINNWLGDDRWREVLLHGDSEFHRDKLLELGFAKALARHQSFIDVGNMPAITLPVAGLKGLEKQVEEQKKRVGELRKLREGATKSLGKVRDGHQNILEAASVAANPAKPQIKGIHVVFNRHLELQVTRCTAAETELGRSNTNNEDQYSILLEDVLAEIEAIDSPKRRRRPRPVLTPFRPHAHTIPNDMELDYKKEGQGLPRKTLLPQPATKLLKPCSRLPAANKVLPDGVKSQAFSDFTSHARLEKPTSYSDEQDKGVMLVSQATLKLPLSPNKDQKNAEGVPVQAVNANKRTTATNPSLASPLFFPPPNTRQRISPAPSNWLQETDDRPLSASSTISDELFSDVDESTPRNPLDSRTRNPERKVHSTSQLKPQSKHQLTHDEYEDNEATPRQSIHKYPSKRSKSSCSSSVEDTERLAEQIVSKITGSNYSPERPSASPTRTNRFGFGFRSPEVSPIKSQSSGFNVFEHSTLLSLATPGSSTSSLILPSNIPIHPSSPDYRPLNINNSYLRLQRPERHSPPENSSDFDEMSEGLHLSLDTATAATIGPLNTDTTPKEELLVSEDYNSVFKSRPKVALSPSFTPDFQPRLSVRQGQGLGKSPNYKNFDSPANVSGSEDDGDREGRGLKIRGHGFGMSGIGRRNHN